MMLAGVLLKLGGYGFFRLVMPLFPDVFSQPVLPDLSVFGAPFTYGVLLALLAFLSILLGAFAAWGQNDFKRLVAYSSINHMGFVSLGIASAAAALAPNATRPKGVLRRHQGPPRRVQGPLQKAWAEGEAKP